MGDQRRAIPETHYHSFLVFMFSTSKTAGARQLTIPEALRYLAEESVQRGHLELLGGDQGARYQEYRLTDSGWAQAETWELEEG